MRSNVGREAGRRTGESDGDLSSHAATTGVDPAELAARRDVVLNALLAAKAQTELP